MESSAAPVSSAQSPSFLSRLLGRLGVFAPLVDWCLGLGLVAAVAMRYSQALQQLRRSGYDLEFHTNAAIDGVKITHPLFHLSTMWIKQLANIFPQDAAYCALLFYCGLTAFLIHCILRVYLKGVVSLPVTLALTASLMQITGLWLPTIHNQRLLGIGSPNTMHNPTTLTLKPFAFLVTLTYWQVMTSQSRNRALLMAIAATVLSIVSVFAKPNFALAFIIGAPLSCLVLLLCRSVRFSRLPLLALPVLTTAVLMYLQWIATYKEASDGSGVIYAPLTIASFFHPRPLIGLLQLTAFPLAVVIWRPAIFRDRLFLLTASIFIVSLMQYFLLAESGARQFHGNLAWGKDTISAIIFPVVLGFAVREVALRHSLKPVLLALLLPVLYFWHLWSGIEYFNHVMIYGQHTGGQSELCIEYGATK